MNDLILADLVTIPKDDPVAFTFFTGYMLVVISSGMSSVKIQDNFLVLVTISQI